jgi:hypothetical protein
MDAAAHQSSEAQPSRPRRRMLRYSLRSLLVAVTVLCVALGFWVNGAQRQRQAVADITAAGGVVRYDFEYHGQATWRAVDGELPGPDWLCRLLGVDLFDNVTYAELTYDATDDTVAHVGGLERLQELHLGNSQVGDAGVAHLSGLTRLEVLWLYDTQVTDTGLALLRDLRSLQVLELDGAQVSDAGLEHLTGLNRLQVLSLEDTQVTDAGVQRLQQALPGCTIER